MLKILWKSWNNRKRLKITFSRMPRLNPNQRKGDLLGIAGLNLQ